MRTRTAIVLSLLTALVVGVAGCVSPIDTGSPDTSSFYASDFFWSRGQLAEGVHFQIKSDSNVDYHTLTSSDGEHITDVSGSSRGGLVIRATSDSLIVDSIGTNTIFLVPPGFSFGARPPVGVAIVSLLVLPNGRIVAGSRNSGIYVCDDGKTWIAATGFSGAVTAMANDSARGVLLAANGDSLYASSDRGSHWTGLARPQPGTQILSLACDNRGRIFAGLANAAGVYTADTVKFEFYIPSSTSVISLAIADSSRPQYLAVATSRSIIVYDDTLGVTLNYADPGVTEVRRISATGMIASVGQSVIQIALQATSKWSAMSGQTTEALRTADYLSPYVYAGGAAGTIYQLQSSGATVVATLPGAINHMVSSNGLILLATDNGVWQLKNGVASSLNGPYEDQPRNSAPGLVLLARTARGLDTGSSWAAGNLYISALKTFVPVTARVIDHPDTLLSPVSIGTLTRFGETYIVRYALESNGSVDRSLPVFWLVYYSRNFGPVIIEEYAPSLTSGGFELKSRATRVD